MYANQIGNMILDELERRQQRKDLLRRLRDASNPFELPEEVFRQMYRLNVVGAMDLFHEVSQFLPTTRITRTPPIVRFLTTIHFLAHGSYQKPVGQDRLNCSSQPNVSRSINEVINVFVDHLANRYVKFPRTQEEIADVKNRFYERHEIPGIIGCIDCTHIKLVPPNFVDLGYPPNVFLNRKHFHSINCQVICDVNMRILSVNARYPGSVHDAAIWRTCAIKNILHQNFLNGDQATYLIGDSGYPLQPYLLTPIVGMDPGTPESEYTKKHQTIRNVIERFNGLFKGIWRCLHPDRVLHYRPLEVAKIIYTCSVLHNFVRQRNIPVNDDLVMENEDNDGDDDNHEIEEAELFRWGNIIRNRVVDQFF